MIKNTKFVQNWKKFVFLLFLVKFINLGEANNDINFFRKNLHISKAKIIMNELLTDRDVPEHNTNGRCLSCCIVLSSWKPYRFCARHWLLHPRSRTCNLQPESSVGLSRSKNSVLFKCPFLVIQFREPIHKGCPNSSSWYAP